MKRMKLPVLIFVLCLPLGLGSTQAAKPFQPPNMTLGPTGMRGVIPSNKLVTTDARVIFVEEVEANSPADGVIRVGDQIIGIGSERFDNDARVLFGKAITAAETQANQGKLKLLISRGGKTKSVVIRLRVMGEYSDDAPFDCQKSQKILEQGWRALASKMRSHPERGHIIPRALNALALLASGDEQYDDLLKQQAKILSGYNQKSGVRTWQYAYVNIFLAEYVLATGDRSFARDGLQRNTKMIVDGQSAVGSWGHQFVQGPKRRLGGYGMMNSPGLALTYSLVLAREADVEVAGLDEAIDRSTRLLRFYVDKGSIPYGDHRAFIETHCDNGKNEMAAVLFDFLGDAEATRFFSWMATASHGAERDTGHTGNFFNMLWALPGVVRAGPAASGEWMKEFGWYYDLARSWDGTFRYQGPPRERRESYDSWDCTGAYLLGYAQALKTTYLTGRKPSCAPQVDRAKAKQMVDDGRGWSNADRHSYYDALSTDQLMEKLKSWSPIVRERTGMALGRRRDDVADELIELLGTEEIYSRYGACQALKFQRGRGAAAVPALRRVLAAGDVWERILAAEALAGIGKPAKVAVPDLLIRLADHDVENDPRNMQQRFLSFALFERRNGLIGRSLEEVDRQLLLKAVRAGLLNEDARSRGSFGSVYRNLSLEELKPLLPAIRDAIREPAPSGIMFSDSVRMAGLELFARHHINDGIELLAAYARDQRQHASQDRMSRIMKMLESYGEHAQRVLPQLRSTADYCEDEPNFPRWAREKKTKAIRDGIARIEASTERPEMIDIQEN